jgi:hypothetical protein
MSNEKRSSDIPDRLAARRSDRLLENRVNLPRRDPAERLAVARCHGFKRGSVGVVLDAKVQDGWKDKAR